MRCPAQANDHLVERLLADARPICEHASAVALAVAHAPATRTWRIPVDAAGQGTPHLGQVLRSHHEHVFQVLDHPGDAVTSPWSRIPGFGVRVEGELAEKEDEHLVQECPERIWIVGPPLRLKLFKPETRPPVRVKVTVNLVLEATAGLERAGLRVRVVIRKLDACRDRIADAGPEHDRDSPDQAHSSVGRYGELEGGLRARCDDLPIVVEAGGARPLKPRHGVSPCWRATRTAARRDRWPPWWRPSRRRRTGERVTSQFFARNAVFIAGLVGGVIAMGTDARPFDPLWRIAIVVIASALVGLVAAGRELASIAGDTQS